MKNTLSIPPPPTRFQWLLRALSRPWIYLLISAGILALDYLTGPFLMFPILFVIPVALSAWFFNVRWAFALAILLPLGRLFLATFVEHPSPPVFAAANALVRIGVLTFFAYLVSRTARQTKELQREVALLEGILHICMFCKRIRDEGADDASIRGVLRCANRDLLRDGKSLSSAGGGAQTAGKGRRHAVGR